MLNLPLNSDFPKISPHRALTGLALGHAFFFLLILMPFALTPWNDSLVTPPRLETFVIFLLITFILYLAIVFGSYGLTSLVAGLSLLAVGFFLKRISIIWFFLILTFSFIADLLWGSIWKEAVGIEEFKQALPILNGNQSSRAFERMPWSFFIFQFIPFYVMLFWVAMDPKYRK